MTDNIEDTAVDHIEATLVECYQLVTMLRKTFTDPDLDDLGGNIARALELRKLEKGLTD